MMRKSALPISLLAAGLSLFAGCSLVCPAGKPASAPAAPLVSVLDRFAAPGVPAMGPGEAEAPVGKWRSAAAPRADLPGNGMAQHPMLYIGEAYNKMFVIRDGKVIWTYSTGGGYEYDDAWMLSNGNILFTRMQYVAEITPEKQVVWRYDCPPGTEVHTCQPIGLDRVFFVRNGLPPRAMIVNIRTNAVEVEHDLPARSLTDPKTVHPQYRRARYTAQGTYLLPMLGLLDQGKVIELDKDFREIWSYSIKSPWAAIRLKNGNTLISDEHEILTREVNPKGETVWEVRPSDLPEKYRFLDTQSCTRLANGNTIICSRGGGKNGPQLVEVTPDKRVVWVLQDWSQLGPATAVQVLDDPGVPENPGESEH
ncbi:MAG TPA: hypothetical protein VN877_08320 [Opitutaceae bacterium]|nr:hypothetical protein [Opitutaceae bacterium]